LEGNTGLRTLPVLVLVLPIVSFGHDSSAQNIHESHAAPVTATDEEKAAVLDAVIRYFASYPTRDVDAARAILHPAGVLFGRHYPNEGRDAPFHLGMGVWLEVMENWTQRNEEHLLSSSATVHGPIAVVLQSYKYEVGEQFSHCGIQIISLVRSNSVWRIASMVWTVERSHCPT
jgi:hypothetical protein